MARYREEVQNEEDEESQMKIYRRAQFLRLPPGTIFSKGNEAFNFSDIMVKGDTIGFIDFYYRDWNNIDSLSSSELLEKYADMLNHGSSHKIDQAEQRDGSFYDTDLFLVFEIDDLLEMRKDIDHAIDVHNIFADIYRLVGQTR